MNSRKLLLVLLSLFLATGTFILTGFFPALQVGYPAYLASLATLNGLYFGGNVLSKKVTQA